MYTSPFSTTDILLVADISCNGNESSLTQCYINHYVKDSSSTCDSAVDTTGIVCPCKHLRFT